MAGKRVAIIGAGLGGLNAVKACLETKGRLIPVCFEQNPWLGGLWHYEGCKGGPTPMYKGIVFIMSRDMSPYPDYPFPSGWPQYLPQKYVNKYIENYAKEFNLVDSVRLQHKVVNVSRLGNGGWRLRYLSAASGNPEPIDEVFDHVIVATGHNYHSNEARYEGMEKFRGEIIHSLDYHEPFKFQSKRVVVIGSGTSGCDIAGELSYTAEEVVISSRSGTLILPRLTNKGLPLDLGISRFLASIIPTWLSNFLITNFIMVPPLGWLNPSKKLSFMEKPPAASGALLERLASGHVLTKPAVKRFLDDGRSIEFCNGDVVSNVDAIILATGFKLDFPFFTEDDVNKYVLGGQPRQKSSCERGPLWLYQGIFPPNDPSIAFLGFVFTIDSTFILSDVQNRYITSLWTGAISLPSSTEISRYLEDKRKRLPSTQRVIWEPNQGYLDDLARLCGFYPSLWAILREHGSLKLAWKSFFAPRWPANFRLVGPGKWRGARRTIERNYERMKEYVNGKR
ncbi:FAD/NAD(P)-binding domain-containing protein [Basidiobolus meristosporus CBS 931.73]|uniref:Flavin-containing monooxygenase 1 n=1 Tax=Basidiobolus meristosporus CBS 931.73 TaxID=1314790 RepID=A0A1Y1XMY0_9FUNG|nr:FAD/NAD(P)-binding domain-containing protein [Basidiobolus meristosporus CBS 931.73]|eukprot:ORX86866.1 FAD/NAD(P)-binding domain-containing protein [Basidiobolus meristosporus CBS 931.73]